MLLIKKKVKDGNNVLSWHNDNQEFKKIKEK